jgi:hypothetical protein
MKRQSYAVVILFGAFLAGAFLASRPVTGQPAVVRPDVSVNVKSFGAKGNGSTDDTAAIQAAINAIPATGGTLQFPPGVYPVSTTINLKPHVTVRGSWGGGTASFGAINGSVLKWTGGNGAGTAYAQMKTVVKLFDVQHVVIDGMSIDLNSAVNVEAIRVDSDNTPNTYAWELHNLYLFGGNTPAYLQNIVSGVGGHTVGLQIGSGTVNQCDTGNVRNVTFEQLDVGVIIDGVNADQSGVFELCRFASRIGVQLVGGTYHKFQSCAFGFDPAIAGCAFLVTTGNHNQLCIEQCQSEGAEGAGGQHHFFHVTGGSIDSPISLISNAFDNRVTIDAGCTRTIVGVGNLIGSPLTLNAGRWLSCMDTLRGAGTITKANGAQFVSLAANLSAPAMNIESVAEGDVLRLTAGTVGSGTSNANPGLTLKNQGTSGGNWSLLFPGNGGLVPGGFVLHDGTTGRNPFYLQPNPFDQALIINAVGGQLQGTWFVGASGTTTVSESPAGTFAVSGNVSSSGSLKVGGGTPVLKHLSATASLDFPSIAASSTAELTVTVTGAASGDTVYAAPTGAPEAGLVWSAYVSAANTVTVRMANHTAGAIDPAARTWRADVWQH